MKYLIEHLFEEKIEHATTLSGTAKNEKNSNEISHHKESSTMKVEEIKIESKNDKVKIKGVITGETEKALMIQFTGSKESWIPKSTIESDNDNTSLAEQEFLIEEWVLKKNKII